jgi:hypothetical protein
MWNPSQRTDDENLRWCWLRAVEWDAYPFFISQPLIPLLFAIFFWWKILIGLFLAQFLWTIFIRIRIVNAGISAAGPVIVMTKWLICPIAAYYIYRTDHIGLAVLALTWPITMLVIVKPLAWMVLALAVAPFGVEISQIGVIQRRLMQQLGYTDPHESESDIPTRACFPVGEYVLKDPVAKFAMLVEFSPTEYAIMGRHFKDEKNFNAPPTYFLNRTWNIQIQTVNGQVTKIAPHVVLQNEDEATQVATEALEYCTRELGSPVKLKTGFFSWKAADGNVVLQTDNASNGWLVSLFLTSSILREFEKL